MGGLRSTGLHTGGTQMCAGKVMGRKFRDVCVGVAGLVACFFLPIVLVTFPLRSCFRTLIGLGSVVDPVTDDLGWTPLHCAVSMGFFDVSMCLVEAGARLDARDCVDNSPIQLASDVSSPLRPVV
jgi:ankyrin repeat protein